MERGALPITDSNAQRACTLSGITTTRERLVSFYQIRKFLDLSNKDLEKARRRDEIINQAQLITKITKATCDAFLGMAAEFAEVLLPGSGAGNITTGYNAVTPMAEALGNSMSGNKTDWVDKGNSAGKNAIALLIEAKAGAGAKDSYKILLMSTSVKVDIINNAVQGKSDEAVRSTVDYAADLNIALGKLAGYEKVSAFAGIAKEAFKYNEAVGKAFDEMLNLTGEADTRYASMKTNLLTQSNRVSQNITNLERYLDSCRPDNGQEALP